MGLSRQSADQETHLMELRHLRYFVAVAEELHFRRAAERLHVAQPAVSEQIRKLEQELGVQLLNRTHRSVSLTPAGSAMLVESRRVLRQAEVAQQAARDADRRAAHKLRVGCLCDAFPQPLARALGQLGSVMPSIDLSLETGTGTGLIDDVRAGRLDVAAVCLPARLHGLRAVSFTREATVAALPLMHRLPDGDSIAIEQLSESNLVVLPRAVNPAFHDGVAAACRQAGFAPSLQETEEPRVEHALLSVALGRGIALMPASVADRHSLPGVVFRAVDAPVCEVALVTGPEPSVAAMQLCKLVGHTAPVAQATPRPALVLAS
jgi:DNA-binding transcriptional LysR family regulator